ncbi:MAG TPA: hypothetical protein VKP66_20030 [Steroidobacteraceae bacterium]|nr:hypothetical protein [Steroidobacteraceae bacterium]
MRVNARFDGEYERQMEFLTEATGLGVSEVLKASVAHYYKLVSASNQSKLPNLRRFIGKGGSGRTDVSVKGKELFGESTAAKHSVKPSARSGRKG